MNNTVKAIVVNIPARSSTVPMRSSNNIADELFTYLDAPVKRVAALDTWVGYHPRLEATILPQTDDLIRTMDQTLEF